MEFPASNSATFFSSIPLPFQETFVSSIPLPIQQHIFITYHFSFQLSNISFINPTSISGNGLFVTPPSISATYFHHSSFHFSNISFINPLLFQETFFSLLPLLFLQNIFITPDRS